MQLAQTMLIVTEMVTYAYEYIYIIIHLYAIVPAYQQYYKMPDTFEPLYDLQESKFCVKPIIINGCQFLDFIQNPNNG